MFKTALLCLLTLCAHAETSSTGFELRGLRYQGPGEWPRPVAPVWVKEYPKLRLRYRASGLAAGDAPVLTLRPGSVGPVTPGATNPENPFVAGSPLVVVRSGDLVADGSLRALEIDLAGKVRTAQIDQLTFTLRQGERLEVESLDFRSPVSLLPSPGPPLPNGVTTLRGRETILIDGAGRQGRALHLRLGVHFAGESAQLPARIIYMDGASEEQFPLLLSERRHRLKNRAAELYSLELDPARPLARVELLDRSPHLELALFAADLSQDTPPQALDDTLQVPAPAKTPRAEPDLTASKWCRLDASAGLHAELKVRSEPARRRLSLTVTNRGDQPREFRLVFPSLEIRTPGAYYLFPRQGAVIGHADTTLEADYSGSFPLQFLDVFSPSANSGACLVVQDQTGRSKRFRLSKHGEAVTAEVEYALRLAPGETFQAPEATLEFHGGDWRQGFAAYREWLRSWYRPKGPRPEWLRQAFWARRDYPVGGTGKLFDVPRNRYTFDQLLRDGTRFGGIDFIDISGWAMSQTAGRVGDYPFELGGAADLRANIALAQRSGIPTGLYFEGYLIDRNSQVGRRTGEAWQMRDAAGRGLWWPGGSPELFACPWVADWQRYLSERIAQVANEVGAGAVYLDEYGFGRKRCYSAGHGHAPGADTLLGEMEMARRVRAALDAAGRGATAIYLEESPPDAAAPYYDAAFSYSLPHSDLSLSPAKLNLSRFAFPDIRLWDMLTLGIEPRVLSAEDFRLSFWHGNGAWLKGHSETWYGDDLLAFLNRAHALLKSHAAAFAGEPDPMVDSPHPAVFINSFHGGGERVYTLFNTSYRTARFRFAGRERTLGPRDVDLVSVPD